MTGGLAVGWFTRLLLLVHADWRHEGRDRSRRRTRYWESADSLSAVVAAPAARLAQVGWVALASAAIFAPAWAEAPAVLEPFEAVSAPASWVAAQAVAHGGRQVSDQSRPDCV